MAIREILLRSIEIVFGQLEVSYGKVVALLVSVHPKRSGRPLTMS